MVALPRPALTAAIGYTRLSDPVTGSARNGPDSRHAPGRDLVPPVLIGWTSDS